MKKYVLSFLKKTKLSLFLLLMLILNIGNVKAVDFSENIHLEFAYDQCGGYVQFKFVYYDAAGDDDYTTWTDIDYYNVSTGTWVRVFEWDHNPDGNAGGASPRFYEETQGEGFYYGGTSGNQCGRDWEQIGDVYWNIVKWYQIPQWAINQGSIKVRMRGYYDGDGSDPEVDFSKESTLTLTSFDAPNGLTASSQTDCNNINLSWSAPTYACSNMQFELFRNTGGTSIFQGSAFSTVSSTTSTAAVSKSGQSLSATNTYKFKIRAKRSQPTGSVWNGDHNAYLPTSSFFTQYSSFSYESTGQLKDVPPAPTNIQASNDQCGSKIIVSWNWSAMDPTYFEIQRATDNTFTTGLTTLKSDIPGSQRQYTDNTVTPDVNYYYRLKTNNDCGWGAYSTINPTGSSLGALAIATNVSATINTTSNKITLTWTDNTSNENGYKIKRYLQSGGDQTIFTLPSGSGTMTFNDSSITNCKSYMYEVLAYNQCNTEGSSSGSVGPYLLTPDLSTTFNANSFKASKGYYGNRVELSWTNTNATRINGFKIFRKVLGSSADSIQITSVSSGTGLYTDYTTDAGVLYQYTIVAEAQCDNQILYSNKVNSIGFRLPTALVNGHIEYEGGIAVKDVNVLATSTSGISGKSLLLDGTNDYLTAPGDEELKIGGALTIEALVRPQSIASDFTIVKKSDFAGSENTNYAIEYNSSQDELKFYISNAGTKESVTIPTPFTTGSFTSITAVYDGDSLFLYKNGVRLAAANATITPGLCNCNVNIAGYSGASNYFNGNIDEIRIWNIAKTATQVKQDFNRSMVGSESGLVAYWKFNEGYGNNAYDISRAGSVFNENHLTFVNGPTWSNTIPSVAQLGNGAYTNATGDYTLLLNYTGNGENYTLTPVFGVHQFTPSSKAVFVGDGAAIQNNIDFKDISSFKVTGTLKYKGTCLYVPDAQLYIDGQAVVKNNLPVKTDASGAFEIRVPIGEHFVTVDKSGHVFNAGRFPSGTSLYNFQKPESGIEFEDSTLMHIVGRVVGGDVELNKFPGVGRSINNLGMADITLTSQSSGGCFTKTIRTNTATGEYTLDVPPVKYIPTVALVNNPSINFGTLDLVDLSLAPSLTKRRDTVFIANTTNIDHIDSISYNKLLNYGYQSGINIEVLDYQTRKPFKGDSIYIMLNNATRRKDTINLRTSPMAWPVFTQGEKYEVGIKAFEMYTNYDNPLNPVNDSVQITDGVIDIVNNLADTVATTIDLSKIKDAPSYDPDQLKFLTYVFTAGLPNFTTNLSIPTYSFTRTFQISVQSGSRSINWQPISSPPVGGDAYYRGIILGSRAKGGNFFTKGPEVVDFILRDPPGNLSSAVRSIGTTTEKTEAWELNTGVATHVENNIKVGAKFSSGLGVAVSTEIKNNTVIGADVKLSYGKSGEVTTSLSNTEEWTTNEDPTLPGAPSDLFVGESKNVTFTMMEYLKIVPDSLCGKVKCVASAGPGLKYALTYGLGFVPGGYSTGFIYTQHHIEKTVIPQLKQLREAVLSSNSKYHSNLPNSNKNYGKNNDDKVFSNPSTTTPFVEEAADKTGPSYTFTPANSDDKDTVRLLNTQIRLWEEALAKNEREKIWVESQAKRDSIKTAELDKLYNKYKSSVDTYIALQTISGVATAAALATVYSPIATGVAYGIATASALAFSFYENEARQYYALKQNIEDNFAKQKKNHSYSGGSTYSSSQTFEQTITESSSIEYGVDPSLKQVLSAEVNGTGFEMENSVTLNFSSNHSSTSTTTTSKTIGYTLHDDNVGDYFSVDVYPSLLGYGPIFKTKLGGATKCPYEGEVVTKYYQPGTVISQATLQREVPEITVAPSILYNVPVEDVAVFNLTLTNNSADGTDQDYHISVDPLTNPFGAILTIDGRDPDDIVITIPGGSSINKVLSVQKGPGTVYDYDSIQVSLESNCQNNPLDNQPVIESVTYVSAHFLPTCTSVELLSPLDKWVINNSHNDTMRMALGGYNINFAALERLRVEYKPSNQSSWIGLESFWKDTTGMGSGVYPISKSTPFSLYNWDLSQITDGNFDLRLTSVCTLADKNSVTYSGIIDRINPHPFGQPTPADGILSPNDEISIQFNEPIDLGSVTWDNFEMKGVLNGTAISHATSLNFDGVNDYVEVPAGISLQNRDLSFDFWVKRNAVGTDQVILSQGSDASQQLIIGFNANNKLYFKVGNQTLTSTSSIANTTTWQHIAIALDNVNSNVYMYINGALDNLGNTGFYPKYQGLGKLFIGKNSVTSSSFLNADLSELRIWNKARQLTEFVQTMNTTVPRTKANLVANWRFDEGSGIYATDYARQRSGEIKGATWKLTPSSSSASFNSSSLAIPSGNMAINDEMDFTLEYWFKSNGSSNIETMVSNGKGDTTETNYNLKWSITKDAANKIVVQNNGYTLTPADNKNYFDGSWHHLALVLQRNSNTTLYIDGDQVASTSSTNFNQFAGGKIWLGNRGFFTGSVENHDQYFTGNLDDFRFWNTARLQEQVARDRFNRLEGNEFGLTSYVPFEKYTTSMGIQSLTPLIKDIADTTHIIASNAVSTSVLTPPIRLQRPVQKVNFTYSINNDKIIFTPTSANELIENVTLDVTVKGIKDKNGNVMQSPKTWIAYVDKNQVYWQDDQLNFSKKVNEPLAFTAKFINSGGALKTYTIGNLPTWLTVNSANGTIAANSMATASFTIDPGVNIGEYEQDITLLTDYGYAERLTIKLKVSADAPNWTVNSANYENSMGIVGQIRIDGIVSTNGEDKLAAFVGDECRGVANLTYSPEYDKYYAIMDLYSHQTDNEELTFKIWNAAEGKIHSQVTPNVTFDANTILGSFASPQLFDATDKLSRAIALKKGWNWISFNLAMKDSANIDRLFNGLKSVDGDIIRGQVQYDTYSASTGWTGSLSNNNGGGIKVKDSYRIKVAKNDTLTVTGAQIDPTTVPIAIKTGWNWIGFISQRNLTTNDAFGSFTPTAGDIIKGQSQFAIYDATLGWVGSLKTLKPNNGYMFKSASNGTLIYPKAGLYARYGKPEVEEELTSKWNVNPHNYNGNMSIIAQVEACKKMENVNLTLGAFINNECRGFAVAEKLKDGSSLYFITASGDLASEDVTFKLLNEQTNEVYDLTEKISYAANGIAGSLANPKLLTFAQASTCNEDIDATLFSGENNSEVNVYPQPFKKELHATLHLDYDTRATFYIRNAANQVIYKQTSGETLKAKNTYTFTLNLPFDKLAAGMYILEIATDNNVYYRKLIKE